MKHTFIRSLLVSIALFMACACHDVKREQKTSSIESHISHEQNDNCINQEGQSTAPLGSIAAQACPVNTSSQ